MARARAHDRDDKADEDRAAAERLLVVKLAAPVAELADRIDKSPKAVMDALGVGRGKHRAA